MKPSQEQVAQGIRSFLMKDRVPAVESIGGQDNLFERGLLDSLEIVALVTFLEEQFGCSLDFNDLTEANLGTIQSMVSLVGSKIGGFANNG